MSWHEDYTLVEIFLAVAVTFSVLLFLICAAAGGFILGFSLALCVWVCFLSLFVAIKIGEQLLLIGYAYYNQKRISELTQEEREDIIKVISEKRHHRRYIGRFWAMIMIIFMIIAGFICFGILELNYIYYK